ncbi:LITAF domain-containing protein [Meloidogyne graminicola]|uniref:LITAF domain-containing protein n=1 Tax=Meloidogyne graminicola TaxID=189291 RepID=A0A8S9ZNJ5_9BILA|nr:LITAF domain-containing protein [Meloidogyne graminicola]
MKPPPCYEETTENELINNSNIYPKNQLNDHQPFSQPLICPHSQNVAALNIQPNVAQLFGPDPQQAYCPTCRQRTITEVKHVSGLYTWIIFICCICVPFCVDSFKDCQHFCVQCHNYIGTHKRAYSKSAKRNTIIMVTIMFIILILCYIMEQYHKPKYY